MANSRDKGKRGELELAQTLRASGLDCVRGQQKVGRGKNTAQGDDDVIGLPGIHIECKRVERLILDDAMDQSTRDAEANNTTPVVMHRKNFDRHEAAEAKKAGVPYTRGEWKVTMFLDDWLDLYKAAQTAVASGVHWDQSMAKENPGIGSWRWDGIIEDADALA